MKRCIYIVPIDLESIKKKGVSLNTIYLKDVGGYFKKVYHIHIVSNFEQEINLNERHTVIEFKLKRKNIINKLHHFFRIFFKLIKRFKDEKIDVIIASEPVVSSLLSWLLSKKIGSKWIIKIVSNYDLTYKMTGQLIYPFIKFKIIENIIIKFCFKRADAVFCLSKDNKYFALKRGASEKKTFVLRGMGCDLDFDENYNEEKIPFNVLKLKAEKFILYVGRLSPEKYPEDFCKIADKLKHLDIKFVLAGDGVLKEYLANKYKSLKNLLFLGYINQDSVKFLNKYAYFVFAPLSGCSLIEAGIMGANILTYDIEWHTEVVLDDFSGKVFDFRDWKSIANYIELVYKQKKDVNYLGKNLKHIVEVCFDKNKLIARERKLFNMLWGSK